MALRQTVQFKGIEIKDAYIRVCRFGGNKENMVFGVSYQAAPDQPIFNEDSFNIAYVVDGDNPLKQAYTHLKTLPQFTDAKDC